ncbi:MAG: thioredoxin domain-containing protein, partial [Acidimicrobiaceae bacterium]|nr:thioredoxin domain-containing protein [Acidimicrobiaceae bacterium]
RPRFTDLIHRISEAWATKRDGIEADAGRLAEAIRAGGGLPTPSTLGAGESDRGSGTPSPLPEAARALTARFDPEWGGFGQAPKFPQPSMLEMLLQAWARTGDPGILESVTVTLDAMASGGIYDHLAGGFARYSTDRRWLVPHFEKMLYDNALLIRVYLHAWQATGAERYRQVVEETVGYLLAAPMRQAEGGFSSAEDADSEGVEGRFYVWGRDEVLSVAGAETAAWYGVSEGGNWEGQNILFRPTRGELARPPAVEAGRRALLAARERRIRPGLDDKVLTEWNAMAVASLAEAGAALGRPAWVDTAVEVAEFLLGELRREDGRWLRSWQREPPTIGSGSEGAAGPRSGQARHLAYAADHAWLIEAFTRLAEATGQARWIGEARRAADELVRLFWDPEEGGFHTAGSDAEVLIARPKDTYDGALPSANSVATRALLRLAALTGDLSYRERAERLLSVMGPALEAAPTAFSAMVAAADLAALGITEVAITGARPDLVATVQGEYRPEVVLAWGERYDSPLWEGREGEGDEGLAYVCRDWACQAPVAEPAALAASL